MINEHEHEALPGLPTELPEGEEIVWQGGPQWKRLARQTFKIHWLAIYFAAMIVLRVVLAVVGGEGVDAALSVGAMTLAFGAVLGFVALLAWLHARATIYTITSHRIVMRVGVALSMTWNLPFKRLASADLMVRSEDDGDVILRLAERGNARWVHFWPHVQPGRLFDARPALRCVANPKRVANLLKAAVAEWAEHERTLVVSEELPPMVVPPKEPMVGGATLATGR